MNQLVQIVLIICGAYFTARFTAITDTENENGEPTGEEITPKAIKKRCKIKILSKTVVVCLGVVEI